MRATQTVTIACWRETSQKGFNAPTAGVASCHAESIRLRADRKHDFCDYSAGTESKRKTKMPHSAIDATEPSSRGRLRGLDS